MKTIKALLSVTIGSMTSGPLVILIGHKGAINDYFDIILTLVVWLLFTAPVSVFCGIPLLFALEKTKLNKYIKIFILSISGAVIGILAGEILYTQGSNIFGMLLFSLCGLTVAATSSLVYYKLESAASG